MCSIYTSTTTWPFCRRVNHMLRLRGPDNTNFVRRERFTFNHNLLSMTGAFRVQPFVEEDVVCLYNGEIYNFRDFGDYSSDGECLIDVYRKYGASFAQKLDGEFAVVLCDFKKRRIVISSDVFRTKPVFYSVADGQFGCSTFRKPLETSGHRDVQALPANTTRVFDLNDLSLLEEFPVYEFNLRQYKDTFADWNLAFQSAIRKRAADVREKVFIGLSSGYDSGVICLELLRTGVPFEAYSVLGSESDAVLEKRFELIDRSERATYRRLHKSRWPRKINLRYIRKNTEPFRYTIHSSSSGFTEQIPLTEDGGSVWLSHVCRQGRRNGQRIYLSGMGADEIFADYGFRGRKMAPHSNFGGLFPDDLTTVFPWSSFYGSSMESYLAKEEYIAGSYGLEARYPFLDKGVVQEFLNLTVDLKNSVYKSVLHNYMTQHGFPFEPDVKRGF